MKSNKEARRINMGIRKKSRNNSVLVAFISTLFITLIVGSLFLIIKGGTKKEVSAVPEKENTVDSLFTKLPETESSSNGDEQLIRQEVAESDSELYTEETSANNMEDSENSIENTTGDYWNRKISSQSDEFVSMAFAGDILFDPGYAIMNSIKQHGGAISGVIGQSLLSRMNSADIMVLNNEFPYSTRGVPTEGKTYTFRAEPSSASLLCDMGVDLVTLANNHAYDYGAEALADSLDAIDNAGVARIGAGLNIEEASHPIYYTSQSGIKVAVISATQIERLDNPDTKGATDTTPGVFRCLDITKLLSRIQEAKSSGAFVIVCIHWGTENKEEIDWWQEKQGAEIVNAGANLIIGTHPHILQKISYINGVPVVYSLGNYLFNSKMLETGLVTADIYTDGNVKLKFIPALQSGCTVNEAEGETRTNILNHMRNISDANIDDEGNITPR